MIEKRPETLTTRKHCRAWQSKVIPTREELLKLVESMPRSASWLFPAKEDQQSISKMFSNSKGFFQGYKNA